MPPSPPWSLDGECLVAVVGRPVPSRSLPPPLEALGGPRLVVAARYTASPVGAYLELAVAELVHLGIKPGLCVTTMIVDSPDSRDGGRRNWGFPKELGTLSWTSDGDEPSLRWEERDVEVRGLPIVPPLPVLVPLRSLQRRHDGPVAVSGRLTGWARPGRVTVRVPPGDPLAPLGGTHAGFVVTGMRLVIRPSRPAPGPAP